MPPLGLMTLSLYLLTIKEEEQELSLTLPERSGISKPFLTTELSKLPKSILVTMLLPTLMLDLERTLTDHTFNSLTMKPSQLANSSL
jgi:hypothetical protein